MNYPLAITQSKKARLALEEEHYDIHGTIEGIRDFNFRAIPLKAADERERFNNTKNAMTLFDLAYYMDCSEQGLREKCRAAYKQAYADDILEGCEFLTLRYKGYIVSFSL